MQDEKLLEVLGGIKEDVGEVKGGIGFLKTGQRDLSKQLASNVIVTSEHTAKQEDLERRMKEQEARCEENRCVSPAKKPGFNWSPKQMVGGIMVIVGVTSGVVVGLYKIIESIAHNSP